MIEGNNTNPENNKDFSFPQIEFDLSAEPQDYSDFFEIRQPFDGTQPEISEAEKKEVASVFTSIVNNALRTHESDVESYVDKGVAFTILELSHKFDNGENELSTTIYIEDDELSITIMDSRIPRVAEDYHNDTTDGGTIKRRDISEGKYSAPDKLDMNPPASPAEALVGVAEELDQIFKNSELEAFMGFDDQPVSIAEIRRLEGVIRQSTAANRGI
jgi:hypothetical protein